MIALLGLLRDSAAAVADKLVRPLVAKVVERFGTRMTVVGAATAVFIGSTGGTAWAVANWDEPTAGESSSTTAPAPAAPAEASEDDEEAAAEPAEPEPVEGLSKLQMANAIAIVEAGEEQGLDRNAWAIALATAMQESKFKNYANVNVAESYDHDYQAEGSDHDSVGLFQQRPSTGWGSVEELMDPKTSASKFYGTLEKTDGWKDMSVTEAAQAVQVSAYPDAYAQWEDLAWEIVESYESAQS
ncbi:hypothetical protein [Glycomyces tarimensis]